MAAGISSIHLAQRFKEHIGGTPKRPPPYRFAATVFAINPAGPIDWGDPATGIIRIHAVLQRNSMARDESQPPREPAWQL